MSISLASCRTAKNINYFSFNGNDSSHLLIQESFDVPVKVGDQLVIVVSALNPASAGPYNLPSGTRGLIVDTEGNILYPQLGSVRVAGLTRIQIRDLLISKLKTFLTDPVVTVDFFSFKVSVLGEVQTPGTISSIDGKINILEALAQTGDLTGYAKRSPIMVIRENKGRREFGYVDITSKSIFSSRYYRLQQNDIVYVPSVENKRTVDQENSQRRFQTLTTIVSLVTTVAIFIYSFVLNK